MPGGAAGGCRRFEIYDLRITNYDLFHNLGTRVNRQMMKWILKWLFRLIIAAVRAGGAGRRHPVVVLDTILRVVAENRIRAQTGMDAEIGKFHLGLLEPSVEIKTCKLYNPPAFGGTPFLNIPEIHVEYDRDALREKRDSPHAAALQSRRTGHREEPGRPDEPVCARPHAVRKGRRAAAMPD